MLDFPPRPKLTVLGRLDRRLRTSRVAGQLFDGPQCINCHRPRSHRSPDARPETGAVPGRAGRQAVKSFTLRGIKSPPYLLTAGASRREPENRVLQPGSGTATDEGGEADLIAFPSTCEVPTGRKQLQYRFRAPSTAHALRIGESGAAARFRRAKNSRSDPRRWPSSSPAFMPTRSALSHCKASKPTRGGNYEPKKVSIRGRQYPAGLPRRQSPGSECRRQLTTRGDRLGDPVKRKEVGPYGVGSRLPGVRQTMAGGTVDAVYIALPNSMHKSTTKAARHRVTCSPEADGCDPDQCRGMIEACEGRREVDGRVPPALRVG